MSIDQIKKKFIKVLDRNIDLIQLYKIQFEYSTKSSKKYDQAVDSFARSLAAYSLICFILQIKDRHNANIMVNMSTGSIIHIDYGFMLTSRMMNFETAPFKITKDFILLLGGQDADGNDFEMLMKRKEFKKFRDFMI